MSTRLQRLAAFNLEGSTRTVVDQAHSILNFIEDYGRDPSVDDQVRAQLESIVAESDTALAVIKPRDTASVFQSWAYNVARRAVDVLEKLSPNPQTTLGHARILNSAQDLLEQTGFLLGDGDVRERQRRMLVELSESVAKAQVELSDSVAKAQIAAGTTGSYALADYFGEYAGEEIETANKFRTATIAGIAVAIAVAAAFAVVDWIFTEASGSDRWVTFASHATIVLGVGALTAYLGRQAGQHRRMYNWAKSMEVQLKSFPAFIEPLEGEVQADIYRVFSHRVLSAPPDRENGSDEAVPTTQILDVALTALKRAN